MQRKIEQLQTILISKNKFPTEHQAIKEVERLGYNSHFKLHPDSTQKNFWRFRQHVPFDQAKYVTRKLKDGNQLVYDYTHHKYDPVRVQRLGENGHGIHHSTQYTLPGKHVDQHLGDVHVPELINLGGKKYDLNRMRV